MKPVISLVDFANPTRCDGVNSAGQLTVSSDGIMNTAQYTYSWYSGEHPVGPELVSNNYEITGLAQGNYTVQVTNNSTGCQRNASYSLADDIIKPVLTASSTHVTNCLFDNGRMLARVINTLSDYDYYWYSGTDTTGALMYTGYDIRDASAGTYTVIGVDIHDAFCRTRPASVIVTAKKEWPDIEINLDAALTYCDPAKANGQLSARVNGAMSSYNFDWYSGTDTTGTAQFSGPIFAGLQVQTYSVRVSHKVTGCSRSQSLSIPDESIEPPLPTLSVLSDMYSCVIPNGTLRASIGGNTSDFYFDWYEGTTAYGSATYRGPVYDHLDVGPYSAVATDRETGCKSMPASAVIRDTREYPTFSVHIVNSLCIEPTGRAAIDYESDQPVSQIEWDINGQRFFGPVANGIWAGDYQVTVYGAGECPTTEEFHVGTDIYVYNGVSPNGDGRNDVFTLGCIDMFRDNHVRIYNRSGQLVYEMNDYNNEDRSFAGVGNRGIYLDSRNVPDGTYFYVIDKRDGSKAISGYLELIR